MKLAETELEETKIKATEKVRVAAQHIIARVFERTAGHDTRSGRRHTSRTGPRGRRLMITVCRAARQRARPRPPRAAQVQSISDICEMRGKALQTRLRVRRANAAPHPFACQVAAWISSDCKSDLERLGSQLQ